MTEYRGVDTLPEWLHNRFKRDYRETWENMSADDQDYWAHEAAAVRRAVARNGFKKPAPAVCIRCKVPVPAHASWCPFVDTHDNTEPLDAA